MTTYVCERPYEDRGALVFMLWADTSDEAWAAVWAVGADPTLCRRDELNTWECYKLTEPQFLEAVGLGVTMTDRWGPAIWAARRDGGGKRLEGLLAARARDDAKT